MAKAGAAPQPPDPAAVLAGLRKALAGPRPLSGDGDEPLFAKGAKGKPLVQAAVAQELLITRKEKKVELGELTAKGRQYVLDADNPKAILEALLPAVRALGAPKAPPSPFDAMHPELEKATAACVKAIEVAFAKLEQAMVKALQAPAASPALDPGPILAALQATLSRINSTAAPSAPPPVKPIPPPPHIPAAPTATTDALRSALHQAYDRLRCFREFQDGLVELPRLYHEVERTIPGLSVETFHRELESLWDNKAVQLHILNEVREAKEPDKAIRRDNKLYYFLYWQAP